MNGTPRQTLAKITLQRAFQASPRKLILASIQPSFFSDHDTIENCGSKIHQNATAESTVGTMKGISTIARTSAFNGMLWFNSTARYRPMPNLSTLATTV